MLKTHKQVPISQKEVVSICSLHAEKLKYFCPKCNKLICADCERDSTACKGHETSLISEAATKTRRFQLFLLNTNIR